MPNRLHHHEKEQFRNLFKQERITDFENRFAVMEAFMASDEHVTVADIAERLKAQGQPLEPRIIRDTLKLLCQYGFARKHRFDSGEIVYEHLHLYQHHDHLVCIRCRNIIEFEDPEIETLQVRAAERHGFYLLRHKMELYGLCAACMADRQPLIPLSEAPSGEHLVVARFEGPPWMRERLTAMGLCAGDEIYVISNSGNGQLVIGVNCIRMVLDREITRDLIVRVKPETSRI
ncbi:transcriptional repressor [Desulfosarcina sp. OttesenSCG-928-G17]|nr:transcriptional repressor [Desulfosarcina sp. OttesenSCG-928-G17]